MPGFPYPLRGGPDRRRIRAMLRQALGLVVLFVAGAVLGGGALIAYRHYAGEKMPPLPAEVDSSIAQAERAVQEHPVAGIPAEYLAGGAVLVLLCFAWALLWRRAPAEAEKRKAELQRKNLVGPWMLALIVVGGCCALIAAIYFGPDTIKLSDTIQIRRGPREEFLTKLEWGGGIIGGIHLLYFVVFFLPRLFGGGARPARPRGRSAK